MKGGFALPVLEAAYNLSVGTREALRGVALAATSLTSRGPVSVGMFDPGASFDLNAVRFEQADQPYILGFDKLMRAVPNDLIRSLLSRAPTVIDFRSPQVARFPVHLQSLLCELLPLLVMANTGMGDAVCFGLGDLAVREWPRSRMRHLGAIAQHLAAAWRLRSALAGTDPPLLAAELRVDGTPTELSPAASSSPARDLLRRAVLARERARTERRPDNDQQLWPALIAGQWTLLDAFTAGGTRYVVAYKNPAGTSAVRALTQRERAVLEHVQAGRSGKWIALELGVSEPTVARALRAALRRIGVDDVAALAGVPGARFEPLEGMTAGPLAMTFATPRVRSPTSLSHAERDIVAGLLTGKRVAAIAGERGTSPRTVAHQIESIYHKLGVSSRRELVAKLG